MFGESHDLELSLKSQFNQNRPTNVKKFWLQKTCYNPITSTSVQKITLRDIVDMKSKRESLKFLKNFEKLTKMFQQELLNSSLHKIMLALILTKSRKLKSLHKMYLKTYWRRTSWISPEGNRKGDSVLAKVFNCMKLINKLKRKFQLLMQT